MFSFWPLHGIIQVVMLMNTGQKLQILGEAARYDVSCASSGVNRPGGAGRIGSTIAAGVCHSWTDDGRCLSLLKVLLTNACEYDCLYCANRRSNDIPRASFHPAELAELTIGFYRRNYIEGLFLSSAVAGGPDATMERMNEVMRLLRNVHGFNGYIHVKIVPGASAELVDAAGRLADRVSVNMELCTTRSLALLAPQKSPLAIAAPMRYVADRKEAAEEESRRFRSAGRFVPGGQSTQMIVGASPERDMQILGTAQRLYEGFRLKRVYYSAYVPVNDNPRLPSLLTAPPMLREHRLYQADWLMRFYSFRSEELVDAGSPDLDLEVDPKCSWALRHPECFPVDVNRAGLETLLRIPGVGPVAARRMVAARRIRALRYENLARMGVVMKRARFFIVCTGGSTEGRLPAPEEMRRALADKAGIARQGYRQMRIEEAVCVSVV